GPPIGAAPGPASPRPMARRNDPFLRRTEPISARTVLRWIPRPGRAFVGPIRAFLAKRSYSFWTLQICGWACYAILSFSAKVGEGDRKSTRLNSSHANISYAV